MSNIDTLAQYGVSTWLDDLSRKRLTSGNLAELIQTRSVVGVTTNPAIFQAAISGAEDYAEDVARLANQGASVEEVITTLTSDDVRNACDLFADIYKRSNGFDGRVSIEVDPRLAHASEGTIQEARKLWKLVNRPNAMIKIPATEAGLHAISNAIAEGISVNVTLIFSEERYREVTNAYLTGLERAAEAGLDLSQIHSVASFFVSRVDTEIDAQLTALGSPDALAMRGKAALANACVAYGTYIEVFEKSERFALLAAKGANVQRPLWASTGVKNPDYSPTMYVDQLVAKSTVNTMPAATLEATYAQAVVTGDTISDNIESSKATLDMIVRLGIDFQKSMQKLEADGVEKFEIAWNELIETVGDAMAF